MRTSGALHARLIWVLWLDWVVYVARPMEFVCCDNLDVPKSPIWEGGSNEGVVCVSRAFPTTIQWLGTVARHGWLCV